MRHPHQITLVNPLLSDFQQKTKINQIYLKNAGTTLQQEIAPDHFRLLSWNIERGYFPAKLASFINLVKPDIVCLQEVDWGNQRTGNRDILNYLAEKTSMLGIFDPEFYEIQTPNRQPNLAGGGVHGNAILTRFFPTKYYSVGLPILFNWENPPIKDRKIAIKERRMGQHKALCAEFNFNGEPITICSTHFEDKAGGVVGRFEQYKQIVLHINQQAGIDEIAIIAGDFNTFDGWLPRLVGYSRADESLMKHWLQPECQYWKQQLLPRFGFSDPFNCNQWTYRILSYRAKYDWITLRRGKAYNPGVGDFNGSDHRPIWTEIAYQ